MAADPKAQKAATARLEAAAKKRNKLEAGLGAARDAVRDRAREADKLGVKRAAIARAAGLNRSRLYKIL